MTQQAGVPHESAHGHVSGAARYTDELMQPAGILSLYPICANQAHAKILSLDLSAVHRADGVVDVLDLSTIPGRNDTGPIVQDEPLIANQIVHYYGQPLAWVVAESEAHAMAAARLARFELQALPAVLDFAQVRAQAAYHLAGKVLARGDADAALAGATHRLQGRVENGAQDHFYLETHASWAVVDSEGLMRVHASTQHPSETQHIVAAVLGWPLHRVVVSCVRMGGGFGGKESQANAFAALVALAALRTGKAARIKLSRELDMSLTGKRHPFQSDYDVGFSADGEICALRAELIADAGWSLDLSPPVLARALTHVDNAYFLEHVHLTGLLARTNKVSNTAFRGFGGPQGMLLIEEILSAIATHLGLRADQVRARNFYRPGKATTHYLQPVGELRMDRLWQQALALGQFEQRLQAVQAFNGSALAQQQNRRRGLAITPVKFGISFNKVTYNQAGAHVLIYADGTVQINHGGTEMGQGLHSKMLSVAARSLGIDPAQIRVMVTSTEQVPNTSATAASAGSDLNGQAVRAACETLLTRIFTQLRRHWQLAEDAELRSEQGQIRALDIDGLTMPFARAIQLSYEARISLAATGYYATPGLSWDLQSYTGHPFYYFSYGAAVSEVELDGYTGTWRLRAAHLVHDVGESLNPLLDIGQIEGGFVQGMGWLTMEELVWDASGRLRTVAPSTYKIPTISEVPDDLNGDFSVALLQDANQGGVIFGSKAVGEPPLMLALSVREALRDAVGAFARTSTRQPVSLACPSTPEALLNAIDAQRGA